jgi:hypothetical protein
MLLLLDTPRPIKSSMVPGRLRLRNLRVKAINPGTTQDLIQRNHATVKQKLAIKAKTISGYKVLTSFIKYALR